MTSGRRSLKFFENCGGLMIGNYVIEDGGLTTFPSGKNGKI